MKVRKRTPRFARISCTMARFCCDQTIVQELQIALLSIAVVLFAFTHWKTASTGTSLDLGFSVCVIVTVLVSYHAFAYDLTLLLLPVFFVTQHLQSDPVRGLTRVGLAVPILILFLSPLQMVLWLRYGQFNLLTPVLLFWWWAIARKISRQRLIPPREPAELTRARDLCAHAIAPPPASADR